MITVLSGQFCQKLKHLFEYGPGGGGLYCEIATVGPGTRPMKMPLSFYLRDALFEDDEKYLNFMKCVI